MARTLDEHEVKIIRELIRNPRISDNKISKRTKIPVMTVNRKRKRLEEQKLLRYYTSINKGEFGLKIFGAKALYIIQFKIGITRNQYLEKLEKDPKWRTFNSKFISLVYLGEKEGHLALLLILDAIEPNLLGEEFNGKIVPFLKEKLGSDCIRNVTTISLNKLVRVHHNYMPAFNMEKGVIMESWPNEMIFVDEAD